MAATAIIYAPREYKRELRARAERAWRVESGGVDGFVVHEGASYIIVEPERLRSDEYEPEDLRRLHEQIANPVLYTYRYRGVAFCRRVLIGTVDDPEVFVENDVGLRLPGPDFIELLRSRADWDTYDGMTPEEYEKKWGL